MHTTQKCVRKDLGGMKHTLTVGGVNAALIQICVHLTSVGILNIATSVTKLIFRQGRFLLTVLSCCHVHMNQISYNVYDYVEK